MTQIINTRYKLQGIFTFGGLSGDNSNLRCEHLYRENYQTSQE